MKKLKLGVLASGGGSNLQSIIDHTKSAGYPADVVVVISNNSGAKALSRARSSGIDALHVSSTTEGSDAAADSRIVEELQRRDVDLVVLAGYMTKVGPETLTAYEGRIINIHPALLPKFGGKGMYGIHVHEAVLEAGEIVTGATVHVVDGRYDHGRILAQEEAPVLPSDTPETLQKRVLVHEHTLLPETIKNIAQTWDTLWNDGSNKQKN